MLATKSIIQEILNGMNVNYVSDNSDDEDNLFSQWLVDVFAKRRAIRKTRTLRRIYKTIKKSFYFTRRCVGQLKPSVL